MPRDLAGELARACRPLLPPEGGLAAVKLRGRRRRRRHRFIGFAIGVTAAALIGGLAAGPLAPGAQRTHVVVGAGGPTASTAPPSGAATGEPTTFVADLVTGGVWVIDSRDGGRFRQILTTRGFTPEAGHDTFGTLSADGSTLFLDGPETQHVPGCSPAGCGLSVARSVATRKITPLPRFDWGTLTPSRYGTPISPNGRAEASTNFPDRAAPTVTVAVADRTAVTYHLPAGDVVSAEPLWSPNGEYLDVAKTPAHSMTSPVVINAATGAKTTLDPPAGCTLQPLTLTNTSLYANEHCTGSSAGRLAHYQLPTGAPLKALPLPASQASVSSLGVDASGHNLIASMIPTSTTTTTPASGVPRSGTVWTGRNGTWTAIPAPEAAAVAW